MTTTNFSKTVDFEVLNAISEKYDQMLFSWTSGGMLYNEEYSPVQECALMLNGGTFEYDEEINLALANWFINYGCYDEEDFSNEYHDEDYNWEEIYKSAEEVAYDIINTYFEDDKLAC